MLEQRVYIGILEEASAGKIYFKIVSLGTWKGFKSETLNSPETPCQSAPKMSDFLGSRLLSDMFCYLDIPAFLQFGLSTV